jgi:DNA polymerase III alpha subunit (gram-positive type)
MVTSITTQKGLDSYFAIDIETTGLSAALGDRVIEIGAACIQNEETISEFEQLICSAVHGVSAVNSQPMEGD